MLGPSSPSRVPLLNCPDLLVINDDELAARVSRSELLTLDQYFATVSSTMQRSLSDDLIRYKLNAMLINSHFYAAPYTTDIRVLYYNITTLAAAGLTPPPPFGGTSWGADYTHTWTWTVLGDYLKALAVNGTRSGLVMRGGLYEEMILAQMIAQSYNAELLTSQPTDESYSTVAGEGSGLATAAYVQAMTDTVLRWLVTDASVTADLVNTSSVQWSAWASTALSQMSPTAPLPLVGTDTLSTTIPRYIDALYYASMAPGGSPTAASAAAADMSSVGSWLHGFVLDSSALASFLDTDGGSIGIAYPPGTNSFLGGQSIALVAGSSFPDLAFNLTYLLIDDTKPYQYTAADSLHSLPPYASTWDTAPFTSPEYANQQVLSVAAKPVVYPLSPLSSLPSLIATNPHRQLLANLAYKNATFAAAMLFSSNAVSAQTFPQVVLTEVGDSISASQTATYIILACILSSLGAWVASIVLEQAIFLYHRHDSLGCVAWLLLTSISIGGGGTWCAILMQTTALLVNAHPTPSITTLPVSFALDFGLTLLLPAIVLPFLGCLLMVDSLRQAKLKAIRVTPSKTDSSTKSSLASNTRTGSSAKDPTVVTKKRNAQGAALTWTQLALHLYSVFTPRCAAAGLCVAAGLWITRLLVPHIWVVQANFHPAASGLVVAALLDYILCTLCLMVMFHAVKGRLLGVFCYPVAVVTDYQMNLALMSWTYASSSASSMTAAFVVSDSVISILTGLLAAAVCLLFVWLQFQRMSLSRYALAQQVGKLRATIEAQKVRARVAERRTEIAEMEKDLLVKQLEFINLSRPLSSEAAFVLAFCTDARSSKTAQVVLSPATNEGSAEPMWKSPSVDSRRLTSHVQAIEKSAKDGWNDELEQVPEEGVAAEVPEHVVRGSPSDLKVLASRASASTATKAPGFDAPNAASVMTLVSAASSDASAEPEGVTAEPRTSSARTGGVGIDGSTGTPGTGSRALVLSSKTATSPVSAAVPRGSQGWGRSSRGSIENDVLQPSDAKSYEAAVHTWIQTMSRGKTDSTASVKRKLSKQMGGSIIAPAGRTSTIENAAADSFALPSPFAIAALAMFKKHYPDAPSSTLGLPLTCEQLSLDVLLQHPVCVELIKDELQSIHSGENLSFYILASRYEQLRQASLRRWLAEQLHSAYIIDTAPNQININTRQRQSITDQLAAGHCTAELFAEAKREVRLLMETNLKGFKYSLSHRMCCWLVQATVYERLKRRLREDEALDSDAQQRESVLLRDDQGELDLDGTSVHHDVELTRTASRHSSGGEHSQHAEQAEDRGAEAIASS